MSNQPLHACDGEGLTFLRRHSLLSWFQPCGKPTRNQGWLMISAVPKRVSGSCSHNRCHTVTAAGLWGLEHACGKHELVLLHNWLDLRQAAGKRQWECTFTMRLHSMSRHSGDTAGLWGISYLHCSVRCTICSTRKASAPEWQCRRVHKNVPRVRALSRTNDFSSTNPEPQR